MHELRKYFNRVVQPKPERDLLRWRLDGDVELRLLQPVHAPEVFALVDTSRAYLREWLPWVDEHRRLRDAQVFIREALGQFSRGEGVHVGIWYCETLAGVIGFHRIDAQGRLGEIGYWLGEPFQGKGLATQACRAMVAYGFSELKLQRIEIHCAPGNVKSRAIPERLGFREKGLVRQAEELHDGFVDNVVYGMSFSEYTERDGSSNRHRAP